MPIGIADVIGQADPAEFFPMVALEQSVTWTGRYANDEFFARYV